jgi:acetyl esterase/lipase
MLTRRSFAVSLAAFTLLPALAEARERGELLRRWREKRKAGAQAEAAAKRQGKSNDKVTVSYGPAKLDIYAAPGAKGQPVVMFVHGGGWENGNRGYVQKKPEFFLKNGYVFVSIDYRMLPEADVATQAKDVEAAYAYVRANIARHGGDPARIAVMGHSAGCHLAALTGIRGGLPGVAALVLNDSEAYDVAAAASSGRKDRIYGKAFPDPALWRALSPVTYSGAGRHPAVLIAYSKFRGHREAAQSFAAKLKAAGTKVTLYDGRAYSHFSINRSFGTEEGGMTGATMEFLSSAL